jgi:hypothetical protein
MTPDDLRVLFLPAMGLGVLLVLVVVGGILLVSAFLEWTR